MRFVAVAAGLLALSGCATDPNWAASKDFAEVIEPAIQEAEAGGASDAQLEILRQAQAAGKLSLEDDRAAARAMVACVEDAGSYALLSDKTTESGLILPVYNYAANTPEQEAIGEACDTKEAFWVNMVYQTQPSSVQSKDAYLNQQAPLVRACLEREGYATDPGDKTYDLLRQALQVKTDTQSAVDCLTEANIGGF